MTKQEADEIKSYLRQAYKLDCRLRRERRNLDKLRSAAVYRSPDFSSSGSGSPGNRAASVDRILAEEERIRDLTDRYTAIYIEIEKTIHSIRDDTLEEVLELRYLHYKKWDEIAQEMNFTIRHITRLHGLALQKMSLNVHI